MEKHFLVRGILIGGSIGVFAVLFGFVDSLPRAFGLGLIGGALAGLTVRFGQKGRKKHQEDAKKE